VIKFVQYYVCTQTVFHYILSAAHVHTHTHCCWVDYPLMLRLSHELMQDEHWATGNTEFKNIHFSMAKTATVYYFFQQLPLIDQCFSLYLSASSSLAIFLLASVLSFSASLWIAKTWERGREREREREREIERWNWVHKQTPSNITQHNSPVCDLVHLVSSLFSITPSKVTSEPICLQRGPLPLDLWQPYGPLLRPDTALWPPSRVSLTTPEEWKEEYFTGKEKRKMKCWLLFQSLNLLSPTRRRKNK